MDNPTGESMDKIIHFHKCFTGRRWINIGMGALAIGFGPDRLVERVWLFRNPVYTYKRDSRREHG